MSRKNFVITLIILAAIAIAGGLWMMQNGNSTNEPESNPPIALERAIGIQTLLVRSVPESGAPEYLSVNGRARTITDMTAGQFDQLSGVLSPDGRMTAYMSNRGTLDAPDMELHMYTLATQADRIVLAEGLPDTSQPFVWVPDSQSLIVAQDQIIEGQSVSTLVNLNVTTNATSTLLMPSAIPDRVTQYLSLRPRRFSSDGTRLFFDVQNTLSPSIDLYQLTLSTGVVTQVLSADNSLINFPNFDPWIGTTDQAIIWQNKDSEPTVYAKNLVTEAEFEMPTGFSDNPYSQISPNGQYVLVKNFVADNTGNIGDAQAGTVEFFLADLLKHEQTRVAVFTTGDYNDGASPFPDIWSSDSSFLLFSYASGLYRLDSVTGAIQHVSTDRFDPLYSWFGGWSPEG